MFSSWCEQKHCFTKKMASVQLHIGSDEEVLPIKSSCIKRTYDYFRIIHEEHCENQWWLCTDISATISKVRNIWFLSPLVLSKRENLALLTLYTFWGKCVFFQFLNDKIHNYVKQNIIVSFIIQKLKNKHTFLKKSVQTEQS